MSVPTRIAVYNLSSEEDGCDAAILGSNDGSSLCHALKPYIQKNASGCYYLTCARQQQLVKVSVLDGERGPACSRV